MRALRRGACCLSNECPGETPGLMPWGFVFAQLLLARFSYPLRGEKHHGYRIQVFWLYFSRRNAHVGEIFQLQQQIHQRHGVNQARKKREECFRRSSGLNFEPGEECDRSFAALQDS